MHKSLFRRLTNHFNRFRLLICWLLILLLIRSHSKRNDEKRVVWMCPQLSSSSKGYFRVEFTNKSSIKNQLICKEEDHLLVYILSTYTNAQRREAIRRTWANKKLYKKLNKICFVFVVGLSSIVDNRSTIEHESSMYNDIVQLNVDESYANVVYKEVAALKWSYLYASSIEYLFKTDDDLVVDTLLLNDVVHYLIHNQTNQSSYLTKHDQEMKQFREQISTIDRYTLFRGADLGGIPTFRSGKFRIHQLAWNHDQLPPYCSGFGFLFSSFIRDRLYRASLCYASEYVPLVGDVFVSGFLAGAASVRCSRWLLINVQTGESCSKVFEKNRRVLVCSTPLHQGKQSFIDFDLAWKSVLRRHSF